MKYFSIIILVLFALGCKSKTNSKNTSATIFNCPEGGKCEFENIKNHRLEVKKDELGQKYYQLIPDETHQILVFTHLIEGPENTMDGNQTEKLLIEIPNDFKGKISKSDESLQDFNMIFDKQCFCRGQKVGVFEVKNGTLTLEKNTHFAWKVQFSVPEISHTLKEFDLK
jgi:hypothetical protein